MPPIPRRSIAGALAGIAAIHRPIPAALAQSAPPPATPRVEPIGRWDADRLNTVLGKDAPAFFGVTAPIAPARDAVRLYRITYGSVVPERGNRPITATGLLAVPDTGATSLPLLSYQHGTVFLKDQVPSTPGNSPETQLALAQFAGQGYAVIAADYFGMGASTEPEGYMVKASHQQACFDMLRAGRAALAELGITTPKLLLGGWSQGGFVTMAFLEKLEQAGIQVDGVATASAPVDALVALNGFLCFPRPIDASWVQSLFILTSFAFENYHGIPGLARALLLDAQYENARKAYERLPFDVAQLPADLRQLVRPEYFQPGYLATTAYGRILAETHAYRWVIRSPVRNYYGEQDEVITPGLGRLAMTFQSAIGSGNAQVEAISTGATNHRGTYMTATPQWKTWFDSRL